MGSRALNQALSLFTLALYAFIVCVIWMRSQKERPAAGEKEEHESKEEVIVAESKEETKAEEKAREGKEEASYRWSRGTGEEKEREYIGKLRSEGKDSLLLDLYQEGDKKPYGYGVIGKHEVQEREEMELGYTKIICLEGAMRIEKIRKNLLASDMMR